MCILKAAVVIPCSRYLPFFPYNMCFEAVSGDLGHGREHEWSRGLPHPNVLLAISFPEDRCLCSEHLSRELMDNMALLSACYELHFFFMIVICYTGLPHACCFLVNPIIYMRKAIWHSSFPSAAHHPIYILTISDLLMASALSTSPLHWRPPSFPPRHAPWIHLDSSISMEMKSNKRSSEPREEMCRIQTLHTRAGESLC